MKTCIDQLGFGRWSKVIKDLLYYLIHLPVIRGDMVENERASEPWWHRLRLVELVEYVDGGNAFFPCPSKILRRDQVRRAGPGKRTREKTSSIGQASALSSKLQANPQKCHHTPAVGRPFKSKRTKPRLINSTIFFIELCQSLSFEVNYP